MHHLRRYRTYFALISAQVARGALDASRSQLASANGELSRTEGQCNSLKVGPRAMERSRM